MRNNRKVRKLIKKMVEKIQREYHPQKIILFGSYAYGEPTEDSDIDILIIKDTDKRPIDRWIEVKRILRDISQILPVSPFVYTEREVEERCTLKDLFLEEIFEKGRVLYG